MFYLFHGSDTGKAHTKAHVLVAALQKKQPDAAYLEFDTKTLSADALDAVIVGQGLFTSKYIVRLRDVCESEECFEMIQGRLKDIAESPHIFICTEGKLPAPIKKKLEKYAEKSEEFGDSDTGPKILGSVRAKAKAGFQIFDLTEAIARRDAKQSWVKYREAVMSGMVPEEIHGMLFWQMKNIVGVENARIAEEAGMKAFPFKKAQDAQKLFGKEKAEQKLWELITLYHEARQGKYDMGEEMERWVLQISK